MTVEKAKARARPGDDKERNMRCSLFDAEVIAMNQMELIARNFTNETAIEVGLIRIETIGLNRLSVQ